MRTKKIRKTKYILLVIILLFAIELVVSNTVLQVTEYTVSSEKLPQAFDDFTIVQLSDLHNASFGTENDALYRKVCSVDPDIVVLTGDMVSSDDTDYSSFISLARKLTSQYPVYFIMGNHEQILSEYNYNRLEADMIDAGIRILDNKKTVLERGDSSINMYGMWFNLRFYRDMSEGNSEYYFDTEKMTEIIGPSAEGFNLLLTHNPVYFDTYARWGADVVLSGHMHGGVIRVPFYKGIFSPEKVIFPQYDAGRFVINGSTMIVNRGLGTSGLQVRVFNRPEISVIHLKSK